MITLIRGISSMATRRLLAELAGGWQARSGVRVVFESVGGVEAARRVHGGEAFDLAVLDAAAIERLVAAGRVVAGSQVALARSPVAIAVRKGAEKPVVGTERALRQAVLAARSIGYSTGPSGTALLKLFERWGVTDAVRSRLVQAPPSEPVAALVARGVAEIGFQQYSEMMDADGIEVIGTMPAGCEIVSVFSAGVCTASHRPQEARTLIEFMSSADADRAKRRHGMTAA